MTGPDATSPSHPGRAFLESEFHIQTVMRFCVVTCALAANVLLEPGEWNPARTNEQPNAGTKLGGDRKQRRSLQTFKGAIT